MLDHLVLATPDLTVTVVDFTERTGVWPAVGASHTGLDAPRRSPTAENSPEAIEPIASAFGVA